MIVNLQQFIEDYRMLDEACRQWYAFIQEDESRADGQGFAEFYEELCQQKYQEYVQAPEDFSNFKSSFPVFIALNKSQVEVLAEVLTQIVCEYNQPQIKTELSNLAELLGNILKNEEMMDLTL